MNRSIQSEGTYGEIKANRGYERFRRRGINKVILEIALISCGFNLHKYHLSKLAKANPTKADGWIPSKNAEEKQIFSGCGRCTHFWEKSYPQPWWVRKSRPFPFRERVCDFLLGLFNSPFLAEDEGFDGRFAFGANRKEQSASSCRLARLRRSLALDGVESRKTSEKKEETPKGVSSWQRMRDSNPRKRSQSPVCYRYTNPLFLWHEATWWRQQDSNLWPHACEACALTSWAMPPCRNRMHYTTYF